MTLERWASAALGNVCALEYGKSLPATERRPGPFPVFGSNGVVGAHNRPLVSGPGIVVGRKGSIGEVEWSDSDFWPIDTTYWVSRRANADLRWLFHLLKWINLGTLNTATGIPGLNREDAYALTFGLPPLGEQKKIAAILSSVDEAIEATQAVVDQLQIVKNAMMAELLTRGLPGRHMRFKQTEIGEVPEAWQVAPLGSLLKGIDAGWSPLCDSVPATEGEWGVLKVSAVSWGEFRPNENKRLPAHLEARPQVEVRSGDLLVSRANTPELVGRCVLVRETRSRLMLSDKLMRLRMNHAMASAGFLRLVMETPATRQQIEDSATGSSRSMKNISQEKLRSILLPQPPVEEQEGIARSFDLIAERAIAEDSTLAELRRLKTALMSVLLTGEVRVKPDDEAA